MRESSLNAALFLYALSVGEKSVLRMIKIKILRIRRGTMGTEEIIAAIIGSNALFAFLQYLITRHDMREAKKNDKDSLQSKMILGLGHDKLLHLTSKYVRRGGITLKEKQNLRYLYVPYKEMGGNGDCEIGYNACAKLPVISDETALDKDAALKRKDYDL